MNRSLVMTVLGKDRPGLVRSLSEIVARHGGNWLESRMARLSGQFAGLVRVECPAEAVAALEAELSGPAIPGLAVQIVCEEVTGPPASRQLRVEVTGNDRPGIVRDLATAISGAGGNVEELTTSLHSAPMAGHPMFEAVGLVSLPPDAPVEALTRAIEALGGELTVDITA